MKFAPGPLLVAAALVSASGGPPNATPDDSSRVTLIRVPHNGIQPEAIVDAGGKLHLLYFSGNRAAEICSTCGRPILARPSPSLFA